MTVKIDKSYEKDTDKIRDQKLLLRIAEVIDGIKTCNKTEEIKNLKKLKGGNEYYRIKIGDYRIGIIIKTQEIIFVRFLHRKEIYRYFP